MVRTDSVSCTVAVFVISHKNNLFSEIILKKGLSQWLLKWGGKIFWRNTLTKPHFCRDRWRGNISRRFGIFHRNELFTERCKNSACFVGSIYGEICAGFMKLKNFGKRAKISLFRCLPSEGIFRWPAWKIKIFESMEYFRLSRCLPHGRYL